MANSVPDFSGLIDLFGGISSDESEPEINVPQKPVIVKTEKSKAKIKNLYEHNPLVKGSGKLKVYKRKKTNREIQMRTLVEEILPQPGFRNYLACNREVRKRLQHWTRHDENVFKLIFEELSGALETNESSNVSPVVNPNGPPPQPEDWVIEGIIRNAIIKEKQRPGSNHNFLTCNRKIRKKMQNWSNEHERIFAEIWLELENDSPNNDQGNVNSLFANPDVEMEEEAKTNPSLEDIINRLKNAKKNAREASKNSGKRTPIEASKERNVSFSETVFSRIPDMTSELTSLDNRFAANGPPEVSSGNTMSRRAKFRPRPTAISWQYEVDGYYENYPRHISSALEVSFNGKSATAPDRFVEYTAPNSNAYRIDPFALTQQNVSTGGSRQVRRSTRSRKKEPHPSQSTFSHSRLSFSQPKPKPNADLSSSNFFNTAVSANYNISNVEMLSEEQQIALAIQQSLEASGATDINIPNEPAISQPKASSRYKRRKPKRVSLASAKYNSLDMHTEFPTGQYLITKNTIIREGESQKSRKVRNIDIGESVNVKRVFMRHGRVRGELYEGGFVTMKKVETGVAFMRKYSPKNY